MNTTCHNCDQPIRVVSEELPLIWVHDDGFANCQGLQGVFSGKPLKMFAEPAENAPND